MEGGNFDFSKMADNTRSPGQNRLPPLFFLTKALLFFDYFSHLFIFSYKYQVPKYPMCQSNLF